MGSRNTGTSFAHGQLYVFLSRVGHLDFVPIMIPQHPDGPHNGFVTHNVVYKVALSRFSPLE